MSFCDALIKNMNKITEIKDNKRLGSQNAPDGIKEIVDIDYKGDGNEFHLLDIYYPEKSENEKLPLIIDIHGGAWIYGKKDINKFYAERLAAQGFAVVNISYRLLQNDGTFPNNIYDIFDAFNWIAENAGKYPFDMNNVFLTGDSAGGHYSAYATAISTDAELAEKVGVKVPFKFNAIGLACAVFDVDFYLQKANISIVRHMFKLFLGPDYKNHPMRGSLSIKNDKVEKFPPVFMNTGARDFVRSQSLGFAEVLKEKGVEFELLDFKKADATKSLTHVYNILYPDRPESVKTNKAMCDFFKKHIK